MFGSIATTFLVRNFAFYHLRGRRHIPHHMEYMSGHANAFLQDLHEVGLYCNQPHRFRSYDETDTYTRLLRESIFIEPEEESPKPILISYKITLCEIEFLITLVFCKEEMDERCRIYPNMLRAILDLSGNTLLNPSPYSSTIFIIITMGCR